jgi:hypothetical protein
MATIAEHIYTLRGFIKQHSDDTPYTDQYLYKIFADGAAVINARKARDFNKLSPWNLGTYCLGLCVALSHDCPCVPVGCKVLKSVFEIPKPLVARNRDTIWLRTLDYTEIPYVPAEEVKYKQYDEIFKDKLMFSIYNRRILVWNAQITPVKFKPKVIQVTGLFEDPTQWAEIQYCNSDGIEQGACFNVKEDDFPLDKEYNLLCYEYVMKALSIPLQLNDDKTNDSTAEIK